MPAGVGPAAAGSTAAGGSSGLINCAGPPMPAPMGGVAAAAAPKGAGEGAVPGSGLGTAVGRDTTWTMVAGECRRKAASTHAPQVLRAVACICCRRLCCTAVLHGLLAASSCACNACAVPHLVRRRCGAAVARRRHRQAARGARRAMAAKRRHLRARHAGPLCADGVELADHRLALALHAQQVVEVLQRDGRRRVKRHGARRIEHVQQLGAQAAGDGGGGGARLCAGGQHRGSTRQHAQQQEA